ncbi:MAG: substrate-binding domain-containing protein, partial [Ornithinimicrobium sp.]
MSHRPTHTASSLTALALAGTLVLAGCTKTGESEDTGDPGVDSQVDAALAELEGQVLSKGPHGEEPASADTAELTEEEVSQVQEMDATAAIVMHYGGNDWANAQIDGLQQEFERLGIEVVAVTDADFKPEQQVSDIETVLSQDPDIIVSIPTDPVATASANQRAADAGVELVFMDNSPQGLEAGSDYVSVVSADNYGNGVVSA